MRRRRRLAVLLFLISTISVRLLQCGSGLSAQTVQTADSERFSPPSKLITKTVDLGADPKGEELKVVARAQGRDAVRLILKNTSTQRLNVVLPPGLVAVSGASQDSRVPSIGLGRFSNRPGSFGQFLDAARTDGLSTVDVQDSSGDSCLTVPAGQSLEVVVPGVSLNLELPARTPSIQFALQDVDAYTPNPRVRLGLRLLSDLGTSQGVAQAVMWNVSSDVPFESMQSQPGGLVNAFEIALAARFVEALALGGGPETIGAGSLRKRRLFLRVQGEGPWGDLARALNQKVAGMQLLGLPIHAWEAADCPDAAFPALAIRVVLRADRASEVHGKILVYHARSVKDWPTLGNAITTAGFSGGSVDASTLVEAVDRALATAFVSVRPVRRGVGSTIFRVENHLPFTLAHLTLQAGEFPGAPTVRVRGVGVGPGRSALVSIQAATATIGHVELNGL
jgi:hypothetical protein